MNHYKVWCPEMGDTETDAKVFEGYTECNAAELWAERSDQSSAEYEIACGDSCPIVCVKRTDRAGVRQFTVTGESVPEYTAREVKESPRA